MTATIKVKENGFAERLRVLSELGKLEVAVGVLEEKGAAPKRGAADMTVLMVATIHEFGAPAAGIPQRSFVRAYVDEHRDQIRAWQREILTPVFAGKVTATQALNRLGAKISGGIQARISAGIPPALAQETVDRKGSSTPLIDTGQLRASITWVVRPKGA